VEALFGSCGISLERPHDMLEWIWLHMAINAGVGAVAAMDGGGGGTAARAGAGAGGWGGGLCTSAVRRLAYATYSSS